jgi:hypothetical protein
VRHAIYARVSSAHQADAHTVASQVVALRERATPDGLPLPDALPPETMGASLTCVESLPSHGVDLNTVSASEQIQDRLKIPSDLRLDRGSCHPVVQSCANLLSALVPLHRTQPLPFHRLSRKTSAGIIIAQDIN